MTPADLDPAVWKLFDDYVHGVIDRRGFLERVARYCAAGVTAAAVLGMLEPNFARGQKVPPDDRRLRAKEVEFPSPKGNGRGNGLLVEPVEPAGKLPGVLVIHENRGLNPHIEDVARRVALEKFVAFAPDALAPLGGYPGTEDAARALFGKLDGEKTRADMLAALDYLRRHPRRTGKLGVVGFCWGGGMTGWLATRVAELGAAVPFYGPAPGPDDAAKIKAPILAHYADKDDRVNATIPAFEAALVQARVEHHIHRYPGTQHGFHNDTTPRYDEAAAKLAWKRTIDFFNEKLRK